MAARRRLQTFRPLLAPIALSVTVVLVTTLTFVLSYRHDLLILASQQRWFGLGQGLIRLGARAENPTAVFSEPALIEYLSGIQNPPEPRDSARWIARLIEAGASPTQRNRMGWSPLMLAAAAGQASACQTLIDHGAEVNARARGSAQSEGMTALMAAAIRGHAPVVRLLVDKGADIHLRSQSGLTALVMAAAQGYGEVVDLLIEKGAAVPSLTAEVAEKSGHPQIAEKLRQAASANRSPAQSRRLPSPQP